MAFTELKQPWPVMTSKGAALVVGVIDYGPETNLVFVCALQHGGAIWCPQSPEVRFRRNWTMGRLTIDPVPQEPTGKPRRRRRGR